MSLSALGIRKAFDALSNELAQSDEKAEIVVVGGAALVLLFGARETTKDVDVQFLKPAAAVLRGAAARVARQLGLPEDWLNDAAKGADLGAKRSRRSEGSAAPKPCGFEPLTRPAPGEQNVG